ncbi:MAG TPA: hypothetical protein VG711_03185 [Phycisphaerales bacterium]|nr:hypothetical protein [Phycisphaerales bacterium]
MSQSERMHAAEILKLVEAGQLDDLPCAKCGGGTMSGWFTNPVAGRYFIWILCGTCGGHLHANCNERPTHFSEERRSKEYEAMDREIIATSPQLMRRKPDKEL